MAQQPDDGPGDAGVSRDAGGPAVAVTVVRSGGLAGMHRRWVVEADASDADPWIALVEACPWDDCGSASASSASNPRGADRFSYRLSARVRGAERQADLAESDAVGPWRTLIDAVRSASAREASD
ncbi:protealysin inhibitor emfourin [Microbacterium lacticum]